MSRIKVYNTSTGQWEYADRAYSGGGVSSWNDLTDKPDMITPPATASVGQTIVVKAVDENGKPTEWEAVDMASGEGSGEWELIADITLQEQVTSFSIDKDMNGNPFALRKYMLVYIWAEVTDGSTVPSFMFLSENKETIGSNAPVLYTNAFEPAKANEQRGGIITNEILPNNVHYAGLIKFQRSPSIDAEAFKIGLHIDLEYKRLAKRDNAVPFFEIGGSGGVLAVGSRIMLWGVRA